MLVSFLKNISLFAIKCAAVVCVLWIGLVAGYAVFKDNPIARGFQSEKGDLRNNVVMVTKEGTRVINSPLWKERLENLDRAAVEARKHEPSKEDRRAAFLKMWTEMKSHMVDPAPGTYPVKYFSPGNGVPLIGKTDEPLGNRSAKWIDNRHVMYWAGIHDENEMPEKPEFNFSYYSLVILDTETGKVVKTLVERQSRGYGLCFDTKSRNVSFSRELEHPEDPLFWFYLEFGSMDDSVNYIKKMDTRGMERVEAQNCSFISKMTKEEYGSKENARKRARSVVGGGQISSKGNGKGDFIFTRPDGTIKEFSIDSEIEQGFKYDHVRDQHFLTSYFSMEDQRIRVWYFDRDFNQVEYFVLPRLFTSNSYPGSSLLSGLGVPVKDGFAAPCGIGEYKPTKSPDGDDAAMGGRLCHIKKDGTMVRVLAGNIYALSSSLDGCKVFGFRKDYIVSPRMEGKNFVVDFCK